MTDKPYLAPFPPRGMTAEEQALEREWWAWRRENGYLPDHHHRLMLLRWEEMVTRQFGGGPLRWVRRGQ